jgi:hypothetical protein
VFHTGIPYRPKARNLNYEQMENAYDLKKMYSKICDELLDKIKNPPVSLIDIWFDKKINTTLSNYLSYIEINKGKRFTCLANNFRFMNVESVTRKILA